MLSFLSLDFQILNYYNMRIIKVLLLFITIQISAQQGGMWIPSLLNGMNEQEMQSLGSKLSAQDIYDVNNSSIKDAIGHFNGGCTTEVISPKGLILTNHHCGFGQIQSHSSLENDYLKNGFWAMNLDEELPNEGLYVDFIKRIDDVTEKALSGINANMDESDKQAVITKNIQQIQKETTIESWQYTKVRPFFGGNQYFLFVVERFEDIRLVGAPPSSIGKFGSDTDNWMWPRHTGDFSLFRIYADKNNRPTTYSKDNVPYQPAHHLPVSLDGISEDDFTMVFGFPGSTKEYLPAVAVEVITQTINPSNIAIREASLKVIDGYMKTDDEIRIKYAKKQASIANSWKKWIGENLGIEKSKGIEKKQAFEQKFTAQVKAQNKSEEYGNLLSEFDKLYTEYAPIALKRGNFYEVFRKNNELMQMMYYAYQLEDLANAKSKNFDKALASYKKRLNKIFKDYSAKVDADVYAAIMPKYTDKGDVSIYENTNFKNLESALKLLEGSPKKIVKQLNNDAAYTFAKSFIEEYHTVIYPKYKALGLEIAAVQKVYMKAMMEVLPEERYFPDANSTLRITYGKVKGYAPKDAVYYTPVSYLDGVVEKYVPNDYEFDVPEKLLNLYAEKDYGQYADANGKLPVCFIGTNHTTGGNSGSPAIDANGNLVGLNFDRVWEGTMSDINYDPEICRNIMVDVRYVLFIVDKFAGATHLIDEMTLVHPKKNEPIMAEMN